MAHAHPSRIQEYIGDPVSDQPAVDYDTLEPGSDIHIFLINKLVSVAPMTIDLTAPVALQEVSDFFDGSK